MSITIFRAFSHLALAGFLFMLNLDAPSSGLFSQAQAVIGRPITPVSYAGVARRTTRRTVYAASSVAVSSASVNSAAAYEAEQAADQAQAAAAEANYAAQQAQASAAQQAQASAAQPVSNPTLPVGSTLPSLPSGCDSQTVKEQSYFVCGANWFRPAMQGGDIVYSVVTKPT